MPHPWECSRPGWMRLWATWSSGRCPCPWQGRWNWMIFKVPSNPNHSMILLLYISLQPDCYLYLTKRVWLWNKCGLWGLFGIKMVSSPSCPLLSNFVPASYSVRCALFWKGFYLYSFWCVDSSNLFRFAFLCLTYLNVYNLHGRDVVRLSCSEFHEPDLINVLFALLQFTLNSNQLLGILKSLYSEYFENIHLFVTVSVPQLYTQWQWN